MLTPPTPVAPVYRYFTVDLLSNRVITEIPFRNVSYGRGLNGAGSFSGSIPVTKETSMLSLIDGTEPGNTALYILRNGKCVWGGIIWSRGYDGTDKTLEVSGLEFQSYFHHRRIWKTWNHQFGGTVASDADGNWSVRFDYGSFGNIKPGSTVKLEFNEPINFAYNGYYRVADTPAPTQDEFALVGGYAVADVTSIETRSGKTYFSTKEPHGFNADDGVTVKLSILGSTETSVTYSGPVVLEENSTSGSTIFSIVTGKPDAPLTVAGGVAYRPLPRGTYSSVTITARLDAFDYIRTLIETMFDDFVSRDFPNSYIEPGISTAITAKSKRLDQGHAYIQTVIPHNVTVGQAVQIQNVSPLFDGEFEVTAVPAPDQIVYRRGGAMATTAISPQTRSISSISNVSGLCTVVFGTPHTFLPGQSAEVAAGPKFQALSGIFPIYDAPNSRTIRFRTGSAVDVATTALVDAKATVSGVGSNIVTRAEVQNNVATFTLRDPLKFAVGSSVTISGVNRDLKIVEKSFDAPNSVATIKTENDHHLTVGQRVKITGLRDISSVTSKSITSDRVTLTTARPHNFRKGNVLTIEGVDTHIITNKRLVSNVATLTTEAPHNLTPGTEVTVSGVIDTVGSLVSRSLLNGEATVSSSVAHNIKVNDTIVITGMVDEARVASKSVRAGIATLTLTLPHNIYEGQKVVISGVGSPYDGEVEVSSRTATRISFPILPAYLTGDQKAASVTISESSSSGKVTVPDGFLNGTHVVTGVTTTSVKFAQSGEDFSSTSAGLTKAKISVESIFNGVFPIVNISPNTFTYALTGKDVPSTPVPRAVGEDDVQAIAENVSIHSGSRTVTSVSPNSVTFYQDVAQNVTGQFSDLTIYTDSIFNGTKTIASIPTTDRFTFELNSRYSVLEQSDTALSYVSAYELFNGTYAITGRDLTLNTISVSKIYPDLEPQDIQSQGQVTVTPRIVTSTFGPFPGNADFGLEFQTQGYAGVNIAPTMYRGFELKTVAEALDAYSDNIDGFEYRVDCSFDESLGIFRRKFIMLPIKTPGLASVSTGVASLDSFGADQLVFEYPGGNIEDFSMEESAEETATRFFAVGETDLGPDAGPNIGVASSIELLSGKIGRRWPLLDATETVAGVDDKNALYAHAERFLSEARPPRADLSVSLNGSLAPFVGEYSPGDWCSLIIRDDFVMARLGHTTERRPGIIVRKISSFSVTVPDAVTFPERVELTLTPEWEVDSDG